LFSDIIKIRRKINKLQTKPSKSWQIAHFNDKIIL
jgi:hypothetical protein